MACQPKLTFKLFHDSGSRWSYCIRLRRYPLKHDKYDVELVNVNPCRIPIFMVVRLCPEVQIITLFHTSRRDSASLFIIFHLTNPFGNILPREIIILYNIYIPRKRYPFRTERPRIVYYRDNAPLPPSCRGVNVTSLHAKSYPGHSFACFIFECFRFINNFATSTSQMYISKG